jgi:hypothetical protein
VVRRPRPLFVVAVLAKAVVKSGFVKIGIAVIVIALIVREVLEVPDEVVEGVTYVADVADGIEASRADAWSRRCYTES